MAGGRLFLGCPVIEVFDKKHRAMPPHQHMKAMKYIVKWNKMQLTRAVWAGARMLSSASLQAKLFITVPIFQPCLLSLPGKPIHSVALIASLQPTLLGIAGNKKTKRRKKKTFHSYLYYAHHPCKEYLWTPRPPPTINARQDL